MTKRVIRFGSSKNGQIVDGAIIHHAVVNLHAILLWISRYVRIVTYLYYEIQLQPTLFNPSETGFESINYP